MVPWGMDWVRFRLASMRRVRRAWMSPLRVGGGGIVWRSCALVNWIWRIVEIGESIPLRTQDLCLLDGDLPLCKPWSQMSEFGVDIVAEQMIAIVEQDLFYKCAIVRSRRAKLKGYCWLIAYSNLGMFSSRGGQSSKAWRGRDAGL